MRRSGLVVGFLGCPAVVACSRPAPKIEPAELAALTDAGRTLESLVIYDDLRAFPRRDDGRDAIAVKGGHVFHGENRYDRGNPTNRAVLDALACDA